MKFNWRKGKDYLGTYALSSALITEKALAEERFRSFQNIQTQFRKRKKIRYSINRHFDILIFSMRLRGIRDKKTNNFLISQLRCYIFVLFHYSKGPKGVSNFNYFALLGTVSSASDWTMTARKNVN